MRDNCAPTAGISRLARRVIHFALKDLGNGSGEVQEKVMVWVHSDDFNMMCEVAGWEMEWVEDVFMRVDDISGPARSSIANQCTDMMKRLTMEVANIEQRNR